MNQENIRELIEAAAVEFDPDGFLQAIFTTLQGLRSDAAIAPNQLFKNATEITTSNRSESTVNTFLRLLGFPATRVETELAVTGLSNEELRSRLSQGETLNYVSVDSLAVLTGEDGRNVAQTTLQREQNLSRKRSIADHYKMIIDPLPFTVSLSGDNQRRPSLFPLVVNADVPVFPLRKRVAPAFFDGDFIRGNNRLSRPFLEHIIYMRTKNFSGAANPLKAALAANIEAEISDLPVDNSNETGDTQNTTSPQQSLLKNLQNFNVLQLQLVDKFVKALKSSAENYNRVIRQQEELQKRVLYIPQNKETFNEKAGQANLSTRQKAQLLSEVANVQNPNIASRTIDTKIEKLKEQRALVESFVQLLPIESLNQSDQIRRLSDPFSINNILGDVFVSEFGLLTSFELSAIDLRLREAQQEQARLIQTYETVRSGIMLYTGEIIGLSIFDVICVLFALFTVDLVSLVALLNESSRQRLVKTDIFYSSETPNTPNSLFQNVGQIVSTVEQQQISAGQAVEAVQKQVQQHFELASSFFRQAKLAGENRTRETG